MGWITDWLKEIPLSAVLREKLSDLEKEHERTTAENKALKTENTVLKSQNHDLKTKLDAACHEDSQASDIEKDAEKILVLLAKSPMHSERIAETLGMNPQVTEFHLHELLQREFAFPVTLGGWRLNQEGRRYLIQRNLIK